MAKKPLIQCQMLRRAGRLQMLPWPKGFVICRCFAKIWLHESNNFSKTTIYIYIYTLFNSFHDFFMALLVAWTSPSMGSRLFDDSDFQEPTDATDGLQVTTVVLLLDTASMFKTQTTGDRLRRPKNLKCLVCLVLGSGWGWLMTYLLQKRKCIQYYHYDHLESP